MLRAQTERVQCVFRSARMGPPVPEMAAACSVQVAITHWMVETNFFGGACGVRSALGDVWFVIVVCVRARACVCVRVCVCVCVCLFYG